MIKILLICIGLIISNKDCLNASELSIQQLYESIPFGFGEQLRTEIEAEEFSQKNITPFLASQFSSIFFHDDFFTDDARKVDDQSLVFDFEMNAVGSDNHKEDSFFIDLFGVGLDDGMQDQVADLVDSSELVKNDRKCKKKRNIVIQEIIGRSQHSLPSIKRVKHFKTGSRKSDSDLQARKRGIYLESSAMQKAEDSYYKAIAVDGESFFSEIELEELSNLKSAVQGLPEKEKRGASDRLVQAMIYCYMAQTVKKESPQGVQEYYLRNNKEGSLKYLTSEYVIDHVSSFDSYIAGYEKVFSVMARYCYALVYNLTFPLDSKDAEICEKKFKCHSKVEVSE